MANKHNLQKSDTNEVNFAFKRNPTVSDTVLIRCLMDATYKVQAPSGITYTFPMAGSEVEVEKEDADFILAIQRESCCGGERTRFIFEKVNGG